MTFLDMLRFTIYLHLIKFTKVSFRKHYYDNSRKTMFLCIRNDVRNDSVGATMSNCLLHQYKNIPNVLKVYSTRRDKEYG